MTDPLSYLKGAKAHECSGKCGHRSGIMSPDEDPPRVSLPPTTPEGGAPSARTAGGDPTVCEDALCEDCGLTLREHEGINAYGDRSCAWNGCRKWVPVGPKE